MADSSHIPVKVNVQWLKKEARDYQKNHKKELRTAKRLARKNGLPLKQTDGKGRFTELQGLYKTGKPKYYATYSADADNPKTTTAAEAASTTSTDLLWAGGSLGLTLDGGSAAVTGKVGIWDASSVRSSGTAG